MENKPMVAFDFTLLQEEGRPGGFEGCSSSSASSPDEKESPPSSFHTPHHAPLPHLRGLPLGSGVASQDSMDIFIDAPNSPEKTVFITKGDTPHQKRFPSFELHNSSFLKGNKEDNGWDDADERTCMLKNDLQKHRKRHWSCGQGSRSCSSSPFHAGHFSLSTNSLNNKTFCRNLNLSPKRMTEGVSASASAIGYVPCQEVAMIAEEKSSAKKCSAGSVHSKCADHSGTRVDSTPKWMSNYVPCAELTDLSNCNGSIILNENKIANISLENEYRIRDYNLPTVTKKIERRKGCCQYLKEEFKASNLKLKHKSPHLFVTSQWQHHGKMSCFYLGYRLFWMAYFLMWAVWSFIGFNGYHSHLREKIFYFIYFPHWGLWLLAVDSLLQMMNVVLHMKKIADDGNARYLSMMTRMKLSWALSNVSSTIIILNSILYWASVFDPARDYFTEITVNLQIIPCLYVLLDVFFSSTPRRLLHAYFPMFFATIYGTFTLVYFLLVGKVPQMDSGPSPLLEWSRPGHSLATCMFLLLVFIPLLHFSFCALSQFRIKIWRKINSRQEKHDVIKTINPREEKV